jgi:hypothetical protein
VARWGGKMFGLYTGFYCGRVEDESDLILLCQSSHTYRVNTCITILTFAIVSCERTVSSGILIRILWKVILSTPRSDGF